MYRETELVSIGKRENNKKRNYLVINPLQGKHVPVCPGKAFELFDKLAEIVKKEYGGEELLVIGFAETATAIGANTAIRLGARYIQTTREEILQAEYIYFTEAHSHATEQKLLKADIDKAIGIVDRIIFIEDEVTTGNTILNIVRKMEEIYRRNLKFSVASILNGMTEESMRSYEEKGIRCHYILKVDHGDYGRLAQQYTDTGNYEKCDISGRYEAKEAGFTGWMDTRRMVDSLKYQKSCETLWKDMKAAYGFKKDESVLVIGTEEFMYPALFIAGCIEDEGCRVRCHSTTRSPIEVSADPSYPLRTRYELRSMYDSDRITYIYDIESCDRVFIITDAQSSEESGKNSLINALMKKNSEVHLIRWC